MSVEGCTNPKRFDNSRLRCFICQKNDHLKKDFSKREDNENYVHITITSDDDSYESACELVASSLKIENIWVMD